jgi:hypothetical protein
VVEVSGGTGTLRFDYARLNELWLGDAREAAGDYGMRRIRAEHPSHPQTAGWWPIGQGIGYSASFVNQAADHLGPLARRPVGARSGARPARAGRLRRARALGGAGRLGDRDVTAVGAAVMRGPGEIGVERFRLPDPGSRRAMSVLTQ